MSRPSGDAIRDATQMDTQRGLSSSGAVRTSAGAAVSGSTVRMAFDCLEEYDMRLTCRDARLTHPGIGQRLLSSTLTRWVARPDSGV